MRAYKFHLPCLQFFRIKVVMKIDHDHTQHTQVISLIPVHLTQRDLTKQNLHIRVRTGDSIPLRYGLK